MTPDNPQSGNPDSDLVQELVASVLAAPHAANELTRIKQEHPSIHAKVASIYRRLVLEDLVPPSAPSTILGNQVDGYRLIRRIGRGGMGVVHLAEQAEPRRLVALKLLRPDLLDVESSLTRFRHEIMAVARLQHPGIVQVFEARDDAEIPYFVMEYVEGMSMAELLQLLQDQNPKSLRAGVLIEALESNGHRGSASPVDQTQSWEDLCVHIGIELCEALQHAHDRGVLHRDIKPSNILLTSDGRARLVDFGLARLEGETRITHSEAELGSLLYIPPENLRGSVIPSERRDVYGLGVTLYEFLGLHNPFLASEPGETRRRILRAQVPGLRHGNPQISWELETVIQKAMSPEPEQRYASARAFCEDLRRIARHQPILAKRPGTVLRTKRWLQRHQVLTGMMTVAFVLIFLATGAFALRENQARRFSEQLTRNAQEASYIAKIQSAYMALDQGGNLDEIRTLLESCPACLRGFEWHHLVERLDSSSHQIPLPLARVDYMAWSPDGLSLAVFTGMDRINILDRTTLHTRSSWQIERLSTNALSWHPRKAQIAYSLQDGTIKLRSVASGLDVQDILPADPDRSPAAALIFTSDGKTLYTGHSSGQVLRIDTQSGKIQEILKFPRQRIFHLSLSGDEKTLVASVMAADAQTPALTSVHSLDTGTTRQFKQAGTLIVHAIIDRRGEFVMVGSEEGLELIDLQRNRRRFLHRGVSQYPVLSHDETRLAFIGRTPTLMVLQVERTEDPGGPRLVIRSLAKMQGHHRQIYSLTSEPGTHRFWTGGDDPEIKVWDPDHASPVYRLPGSSNLVTAMLALDGRILTGDSKGLLRLQDATSSRVFPKQTESMVTSLDFDHEGRILVSHKDGTLAFLGPLSGNLIWRRQIKGLSCARLTREGYAYGTKDGQVHIHAGVGADDDSQRDWNALEYSQGTISALDHHAKKDLLLIASTEGLLRCYDLEHREEVWQRTAHKGWISDARIDPAGRYAVSLGQDKTVAIWELQTGNLLHRLKGMDRASLTLTFSPDGQRLVTSSGYSSELRIWDPQRGVLLARLRSGCMPFAVCFLDSTLVTAGMASSSFGRGGAMGEIMCFRGKAQAIPPSQVATKRLDADPIPPPRLR